MEKQTVKNLKKWLGSENIRYFQLLKSLTGTYSPVLKLNFKRKGIPIHPVHLREGMQIRNWMRQQEEFKTATPQELDDKWILLIEKACNP